MPSTTQYFLSIDNGTQSVRALIFDQNGELIAKSKMDIEAYVSPHPGWAEQRAEYFWESVCLACQQLWPTLSFASDALTAVSITTQRATTLALNSDGEAVYPAISWLDQRLVRTKPDLHPVESCLMSVLGAKSAANKFHANAEANWIAQHRPELWEQVDKFLLLSGYHVAKLTGKDRDAIASQVGYVPFDFKKLEWAAEKDWQWRASPITRNMLPDLLPAGTTLGYISEQAAAATGIPQGLPLIASGSDKACEVLGSGCLDDQSGSLSYGTTATFNLTSDRYVEAVAFQPPYPGIVPGTYNVETYVPRGYWMVNWFKNEFGLSELLRADEEGVSVESLFDDLLRAVPPGAMGLMLQPYWSTGAVNTGPEAKGAIVGFGDVHTRAHVYRALIEGLTYALREGKELVEKRTKCKIKKLMVSGGGSQSDEVMQITADIFGMPAVRPHTFETSGLGAAMAAAVGVGAYPDFQTAVRHMSRERDRFSPVSDRHQVYDRLYKDVYRKMYDQLRPGYEAIRAITGYPL